MLLVLLHLAIPFLHAQPKQRKPKEPNRDRADRSKVVRYSSFDPSRPLIMSRRSDSYSVLVLDPGIAESFMIEEECEDAMSGR